MTTNEMLRLVLSDYGFVSSENDNVRYMCINHRDQWILAIYENDNIVAEVWQALCETDVMINLNDTSLPYSINYLSVPDLKYVRIFNAFVLEISRERVVFTVGENTFVVIDLEANCKQHQTKRKVVVIKAFEN